MEWGRKWDVALVWLGWGRELEGVGGGENVLNSPSWLASTCSAEARGKIPNPTANETRPLPTHRGPFPRTAQLTGKL